MNDSYQGFLNFANKLADAASTTSMQYFRTSIDVDNKSDESPVTIADKNKTNVTWRLLLNILDNKYYDSDFSQGNTVIYTNGGSVYTFNTAEVGVLSISEVSKPKNKL